MGNCVRRQIEEPRLVPHMPEEHPYLARWVPPAVEANNAGQERLRLHRIDRERRQVLAREAELHRRHLLHLERQRQHFLAREAEIRRRHLRQVRSRRN